MLSDLHYKLIMNEKPQKKGRTQVLAESYHPCPSLMPICMLRGDQFWAPGEMPLCPATAGWLALSTKGLCSRDGRLHTLPLLSRTLKTGVAL